MPLTVPAVRNAKPRKTPYKLADEKGLYLRVNPDGSRYWRLKYRFGGKEKLLALGVAGDVTLAEARAARDEAKRKLRAGIDPAAVRKAEKLRQKFDGENSFKAVARRWIGQMSVKRKWGTDQADRVETSLVNDVYADIGHRPIADIKPPEVLAVLRKIEDRGAHEIRGRVQQRIGAVFRYAVAHGLCESDPTRDLRDAFETAAVTHRAALAEKDLPEFLEKVDDYNGEPTTKLAIKLLVLIFVRPGRELRQAEWTEFDLDAAVWRVPAARVKMRDEHIVPLSTQAVAVLRELQALTGGGRFVFPHRSNPKKVMSENTILYALYRMGYHSRATAHGFRTTASTILNETGFPPDVIERQLAHAERNKVRAAYNRAQYLPERTKMMQAWADLVDAIKAKDKKVLRGRFGKAA